MKGLSFFAAAAAFSALLATPATAQTFCPTAPATPGDRRVDKTKLTYSTYNTEFLFLVGYGQLNCPGSDCKWTNEDEARQHIKQVAQIIRKLDADIVQMTEVEDCAVLGAVIQELAVLGDRSYKPYMVKGTDTATGQNVGLITRVDPVGDVQRTDKSVSLPVSESKCPSASGYSKSKSVAKNLFATFRVSGFSKPITVVGAHFMANPTDKKRCFEREGQATVIASVATDAAAAGNHVIISGDLNDWSRSSPDRNGNRPISNALGILERPGFVNAGSLADPQTRYSQWFDRNKDCQYELSEVSSLDHIVVSKSLQSGVANVTFHGSDLYQASCGGYNSDHYPITMTLRPV
ncbi:hypothetical protein PINS_up011088 [Pythium insidiosum]|nr:hypothetical protein PINS_up011086 [Pythium insidiosum]GLE02250.1 hypothetical protein PINS_up011088 [Pythium insidiosum]